MDELLKIIGKINFYQLNIDDILQGRELDVFKHEWDRVAFEIELMKDLNGFSPEKEKFTKQVREKASMRIYESSGDSDLADCISGSFSAPNRRYTRVSADPFRRCCAECIFKNTQTASGKRRQTFSFRLDL